MIRASALGVPSGLTPYFQSKLAADHHLQSLPVSHSIVRPALVYGPLGASAAFFRMLASLPIHALPAGGHQRLRPVHVEELAEVIERLRSMRTPATAASSTWLAAKRSSIARCWPSTANRSASPRLAGVDSGGLIGTGAALLDRVPGSMLTRDTANAAGRQHRRWRRDGKPARAPGAESSRLHRPRCACAALPGSSHVAVRAAEGVLAFVWLWTSAASLRFPRDATMALLARAHLHDMSAVSAFYAAVCPDFAFGVMTIVKPGRLLWLSQAVLVATYVDHRRRDAGNPLGPVWRDSQESPDSGDPAHPA